MCCGNWLRTYTESYAGRLILTFIAMRNSYVMLCTPTGIVRVGTGVRYGALCRNACRCEHCDESFECRKSEAEGIQVFFFF